MEESIKIELGDWNYNAGIIGLINILNDETEECKIEKNYIEFSEQMLDDFEEKYFDYLFEKYEKNTVYGNIVKKIDLISSYLNMKEMTTKELDVLNDTIDYVKSKLKRKSYMAAYPFIKGIDILEEAKKLNTVKLKKKESILEKKEEIKYQLNLLMDLLIELRKDEYKKYILAKDIIYSYTNEFLSNVAMWGKNENKKDPYVVFQEYFIAPIKKYIEKDKTKYKMSCTCCGRPIKNLKESYDLTWIVDTGVDGARKSSHYWNYNSDTRVCPICNLVYACIPAGIVYSNRKGFFINENQSIQKLREINNFNDVENDLSIEELEEISYFKIVNAIEYEAKTKRSINEIQNIQIVKYNLGNSNNKYMFNILSKRKLNIIYENRKELSGLLKGNVKLKDQKTYVNLYQEVLKRIYSNENLYDLIYTAIKSKVYSYYINNILIIAYSLFGGKRKMNNINGFTSINSKIQKEGKNLRQEYKKKGSETRIQAIIYKLLTAIRVKNTASFSEILIKLYVYINKPVPEYFVEALGNEEKLQLYGYSFLMGLTGEEKKTEEK